MDSADPTLKTPEDKRREAIRRRLKMKKKPKSDDKSMKAFGN